MLKAKVYHIAQPSVDALETSLLREWAKISQEKMGALMVIFDKELNF